MSAPWSPPDPRRPTVATADRGTWSSSGTRDVVPGGPDPGRLGADVRTGTLTALITVLVGAPVGLLWSALAPRADVVVTGTAVDLVEPHPSAFIAADGYFLAAVVLAGVLGGLAAWALARPRGPGVVAGLAVGGLAAAYVAMVVGEQVGYDEARAAVEGARQGALSLSLELRAHEALVGWPVGGLLVYLFAAWRAGPDPASWG